MSRVEAILHPDRPAADPVPMISVCMFCHRQIVSGHWPTGLRLAPVANQSHGICKECAPAYFDRMGLTKQQQAQIMGNWTDEPKAA